ncbi:MAG: hypothetical protein A2992_03785 [Elusimicrobia bacterium RIFCSPLOWO2_01_FULL_59_12]|nr:MAG: hypothetical protein A2992_03785 [Elusimicrobia bacterium RIFCSPLOWO2_01_FULL_59_12]
MPRRNQVLGLSLLTFTSLLLIALAVLWGPAVSAATVWALVWAGSESLLAFFSLSWSLGRSNRVFLSMFAGGALVRLISIGVATYVLTALKMSPTVPLLSLVFAYFLLSLLQMPFLKSEAAR